jgi:hypothetical protein
VVKIKTARQRKQRIDLTKRFQRISRFSENGFLSKKINEAARKIRRGKISTSLRARSLKGMRERTVIKTSIKK